MGRGLAPQPCLYMQHFRSRSPSSPRPLLLFINYINVNSNQFRGDFPLSPNWQIKSYICRPVRPVRPVRPIHLYLSPPPPLDINKFWGILSKEPVSYIPSLAPCFAGYVLQRWIQIQTVVRLHHYLQCFTVFHSCIHCHSDVHGCTMWCDMVQGHAVFDSVVRYYAGHYCTQLYSNVECCLELKTQCTVLSELCSFV